jgi:hypothetical protein
MHLTALEGAEIIPGKHSDTRIKPSPLTNGHGRYITVTPERALCVRWEMPVKYQSPCFEVDRRCTQDLGRRTEITPVQDSHTRIEPLALASGHGRYITVTPERTLVFVGEWNGRCM